MATKTFEEQAAKLRLIAGEDSERLLQHAREVATVTRYSAAEVAEALVAIGSVGVFGIGTDEMIDIVNELAGVEGMTQTVNGATVIHLKGGARYVPRGWKVFGLDSDDWLVIADYWEEQGHAERAKGARQMARELAESAT